MTELANFRARRYVLSPTHLHEFKSADKTQAPVMSLYLPEQKLGSHSTEGGSSNKFILKGRQTGSMHRGHTWVFRAESHDTMMAWYEDIKALTEKSPEELSHFVRDHSRSFSRSSQRSLSSDGNLDADEDEEPFTPDAAAVAIASPGPRARPQADPNRPEPGGRFPSDLEVTAQRGLQVPLSPSSASSGILEYGDYAMRGGAGAGNSNPPNQNMNMNWANANDFASQSQNPDHSIIAAAVTQPGSGIENPDSDLYASAGNPNNSSYLAAPNQANMSNYNTYGDTQSIAMDQAPSHAAILDQEARQDGVNPYNGQPLMMTAAGYAQQHPVPPQQQQQYQPQAQSQNPNPNPNINSNRFSYTADSETLDTLSSSGLVGTSSPGYVPNGGGGGVSGAAQLRGSGKRTDSTPHVPGEYPRSSVATTPGA